MEDEPGGELEVEGAIVMAEILVTLGEEGRPAREVADVGVDEEVLLELELEVVEGEAVGIEEVMIA